MDLSEELLTRQAYKNHYNGEVALRYSCGRSGNTKGQGEKDMGDQEVQVETICPMNTVLTKAHLNSGTMFVQ